MNSPAPPTRPPVAPSKEVLQQDEMHFQRAAEAVLHGRLIAITTCGGLMPSWGAGPTGIHITFWDTGGQAQLWSLSTQFLRKYAVQTVATP